MGINHAMCGLWPAGVGPGASTVIGQALRGLRRRDGRDDTTDGTP